MPLIPVQDIFCQVGLGINFTQWIPLRPYTDTQFVAVALFVDNGKSVSTCLLSNVVKKVGVCGCISW